MPDVTTDVLGAIKALPTQYETYDGSIFNTFEEAEKYSIRKRLVELVNGVLEMYLINTAVHVRDAIARQFLEDLEITQLMAINFKYMLQEKDLKQLVESVPGLVKEEETAKPEENK